MPPRSQRIDEAGAGCPVIALAGLLGRLAGRAVRVRDAILNVSRGAPEDRLQIGRRELWIALQEERADTRKLGRGGGGSAKDTPAIVDRGAVPFAAGCALT